MQYQIIQGDNREALKSFPDNHFDSIVTDPPYGIDFLGKAWDANTGALETYQECLRVLKPGGHILAFSAARTYHHLAVTLEQAGFEIRDQIMWIYSSGFPKSQDVGKSIDRAANKASKTIKNGTKKGRGEKIEGFDLGSGTRCPECKRDSNARYACDKGQECGMVYKPQTKEAEQWSGWGTQLKPAHEPIALARKPIKLSIARNCQTHGVGALNIDATRVPYEDADDLEFAHNAKDRYNGWGMADDGSPVFQGSTVKKKSDKEKIMDWANKYTSPGMQEYAKLDGTTERTHTEEQYKPTASPIGRFPSNVLGEIPDYQKYFYCPKVSRAERHIGFDDVESLGNQLYSIGGYWIVDNQPQPFSGSAPGNQCYVPGVGNIFVHGLKHELEKVNEKRGIKTHWQMAEEMGGSLVDHEGNPTRSGNKALIPGVGDIYTHSLSKKYEDWCKQNNKSKPNVGNNHPTVKPIELMKYLIKLITPPGGTVLDPFNGSGSTGCAAVELGYDYTGIELDLKYVDIARKRIQAWYEHTHPTDPLVASGLFEQC